MKSFLLVLGSVLCFSYVLAADKSGDDEKSDEWMDKYKPEFGRCQDEKLTYPRALRDASKECEDFRKKSEDSREKLDNPKKGITCEHHCIWKTMGFLSEDEEYNSKKFEQTTEEEFDGKLEINMLRIMKNTKQCAKELDHDVKDNIRCKRFKKFFSCVFQVRKEQCKDKVEKSASDDADSKKLKQELAQSGKTGGSGSNQKKGGGGLQIRLG